MIVEYRCTDRLDKYNTNSKVLRTYKDVTRFSRDGNFISLYGTEKWIETTSPQENTSYHRGFYDHDYVIVIINLAPGEYLERVDLPRD
jgi:hypothetical protein